jgi:hypothetical protein
MRSGSEPTLFEEVVQATDPYLGPASERFIARQIHSHLKKDPADLNVKDLDKLTDWVRASLAVLTEDHKIIEEFAASLRRIAKSRTGN